MSDVLALICLPTRSPPLRVSIQVGAISKSNKTSMPYDPISLEYGEGRDGECLRYSDEALKYRSALRAEHLQRRMNGSYNPITGAELQRVPVPQKPEAPAFMLQNGGEHRNHS